MSDPLQKCFQCGQEFQTGQQFWYCPECNLSACEDCAEWHEHPAVSVKKIAPAFVGRILLRLQRLIGL